MPLRLWVDFIWIVCSRCDHLSHELSTMTELHDATYEMDCVERLSIFIVMFDEDEQTDNNNNNNNNSTERSLTHNLEIVWSHSDSFTLFCLCSIRASEHEKCEAKTIEWKWTVVVVPRFHFHWMSVARERTLRPNSIVRVLNSFY